MVANVLNCRINNVPRQYSYFIFGHKLFIYAFIFTEEKRTSISEQRPATSFRFEYYIRFIRMSMYIYSKSKRVRSIVKKSLENAALYSTRTKKKSHTAKRKRISRSEGFASTSSVEFRFQIRDTTGIRDSERDEHAIHRGTTRSAALKSLTKIIPSSRVEYRTHTTLTIEV